MAEAPPIVNPPVLENATSVVEADGTAQPPTTTENGSLKENNGQDVTMAGLEDSGTKPAKAGDNPGLALASSNNPVTTASSSTNPPTPNRTSTPTGTKDNVPARLDNNNNNSSSRAASAATADRTVDRVTMPTEPAAHGAPTRQYLNSKLTYHVMEGMKIVAKEQPADPLRVLGEFLLKRSGDLERAAAANGTPAAEGDKENLKQNGDITTEQ